MREKFHFIVAIKNTYKAYQVGVPPTRCAPCQLGREPLMEAIASLCQCHAMQLVQIVVIFG